MSKQRDLVLSILESNDGHVTADDVYLEARRSMPSISMGTVYRNLSQLSSEGHIREVHIPGAPSHYEKIRKPHGHMICVRCGKITDMPPADIDKLQKALGTEILSYSCSVHYLCPDCKKAVEDEKKAD